MRPRFEFARAGARPVALVVVVLACALAAPPAAGAGGTSAQLRSGGAAYGAPIPLPDKQPIVRRVLLSPATIVAGDAPPQIRFRVRQRGIERVQARVVVLRMPRRAPVARMSLGWVKPGARLAPRWPSDVKLQTGRYLVRVHVKDPRGRTLKRSARQPGRARIVVRRAPPVVTPGVAIAPAPLWPDPSPSPGGPGVFPVPGEFDFGSAAARFGAGRVGHTHEGQDISAPAGTPIVAPYAGIVASASYQRAGAGEYVVLDAADGRDYFFAHCLRQSTVVAEGAAVAAGQQLCAVGATGTTSGETHLHFEIWNVGWRVPGGFPIDPLPELRAWSGR